MINFQKKKIEKLGYNKMITRSQKNKLFEICYNNDEFVTTLIIEKLVSKV